MSVSLSILLDRNSRHTQVTGIIKSIVGRTQWNYMSGFPLEIERAIQRSVTPAADCTDTSRAAPARYLDLWLRLSSAFDALYESFWPTNGGTWCHVYPT